MDHGHEVVERLTTPRGELVLRRSAGGEHFEIISNGVFLMDTRGGASERLLVRAALDRRAAPAHVLIGGLGVGFSLSAALDHPRTAHVTVVELEPAVIAWHADHLVPFSRGALRDPRVQVVQADLLGWLRAGDERFDVICADIDNGPDWTVTDTNAALYDADGLDTVSGRLHADGTFAVWSAAAAPAFAMRLDSRFAAVEVHTVPVPRGAPDHVYLAHRPR